MAVTDCKAVYDITTRTSPPQCEEHRTTIECLLTRERMMENCRLRWVASGAMLADCRTKFMDPSKLRECLRTGQYSLFDEQMVLKQRSDRRQRLSWVKQQNSQPEDKKESETCLQNSHEPGDFWKLDRKKGWLDRIHRNPRWVRFTPIGVMGCPVSIDEIGVS